MDDSDADDQQCTTTEASNINTVIKNIKTEPGVPEASVQSIVQFASPVSGLDKTTAVTRSLGCLQGVVRSPIISSNCQTILVTSPALPHSLSQTGVKVSPSLSAGSISLLTSNLGLVPTAMNGVLNHLSPVEKTNKSGKHSASPKSAIASPVKNVFTPNKCVLTNSVRLPNNQQQNLRPVTQNLNSNIYFVKYVDNQGKTILIPQQMCSSGQISMDKNNSAGATKGRSQPVIPVINFSNAASLISPPKVVQSQASIVRPANSKTVLETAKPVQPLIIKQDTSASSPVTNIILPMDKNMRGLTPGQTSVKLVGSFLPRQAVTTVKGGAVSGPRSQLKVTSQGLIHVPNANGTNSLQRQNKDGCILKAVPNPQITIQPQPQIILQPNNNKVLKGKSLLSNLTLNTCDKSLVNVSLSSEMVTATGSINSQTVSAGAQPIKISAQNDGKSRPIKPANNFLIVPVSQQTLVSDTNKLVNNSHANFNNKVNVNSGKLMLDMKSTDKKMLIVVQNDLSKTSHVNLTSVSTTSPSVVGSASNSLSSKSQLSTVNSVKASSSEMPVVISSSDQKKKQVILVQDSVPNSMKPPPLPMEKEKKIISIEPKKKKQKPLTQLTSIKPMW